MKPNSYVPKRYLARAYHQIECGIFYLCSSRCYWCWFSTQFPPNMPTMMMRLCVASLLTQLLMNHFRYYLFSLFSLLNSMHRERLQPMHEAMRDHATLSAGAFHFIWSLKRKKNCDSPLFYPQKWKRHLRDSFWDYREIHENYESSKDRMNVKRRRRRRKSGEWKNDFTLHQYTHWSIFHAF